MREQYPLYAGSSSVFAVLNAANVMEAKERTEEQIRARVKKLGLTAASPARPMDGSGDSDDDADDGPDDRKAEGNIPASGEEDNAVEATAEDPGSAKLVNVRRLKRKNQAESDDDSEGLFSSSEVSTYFPSVFLSRGMLRFLDRILVRMFAAGRTPNPGLEIKVYGTGSSSHAHEMGFEMMLLFTHDEHVIVELARNQALCSRDYNIVQ